MKLKRTVIAVVAGATVLGAIGVAASAFGSNSAAPDRVIVERIGGGQTLRWTVATPHEVLALYRDTRGLPEPPSGQYACPMIASLYMYRLTFLDGSDTVLVASFDPGGCRTVQLTPGGMRWAEGPVGDRFWAELAQAMGIHVEPPATPVP